MSPDKNKSTAPHEDPDFPLTLVCSACRAGPFSYEGFCQARATETSDDYSPIAGYCYKRTWAEISQSFANEACNWCRILLRTRDALPADRFPTFGEESVEVKLEIKTLSKNLLTICINDFEPTTYTFYVNSGDKPATEIGREQHTVYKTKETYVDYQKAMEYIKSECSTHEHCPSLEETTLPTRVIDCSDPSKPRLVETNRQMRGHYCTLGYVWGRNQLQKTTKTNIDAYRKCIDVPLPQTIADAISVTHKLGLRYLWVDALCIIQDSNEDKENELGIMAYIYRDAYLSISVLSSFRADQGFLPDERAPDVLPFHLANKSIGHMLAEYVFPRQTMGMLVERYPTMQAPLEERGWCFQESTMSPRKLIFEPPMVSYDCRSFNRQNITRPSISKGLGPYPNKAYILFPTSKGRAASPDPHDIQWEWQQMLKRYSECRLTFPSDKFVAFASIAETFQSILKDDYVAGLWRGNLLYDLLWKIDPLEFEPDRAPLPRPSVYRAPTWSWASVDAKLKLDDTSRQWPPVSDTTYEAEILKCEVTPKVSTLPFGEITYAYLRLRVKMHPLMFDGSKCTFIERKGYMTYWIPPQGNNLKALIDDMSDSEKEQYERRLGIRITDWEKEQEQMVGRFITFDSVEGTEQDHPRHFYIVILRRGSHTRCRGDWMQGILVVPVEGKEEEYRRVAKLNCNRDEWPDWFDATPLKIITLV